MKPPLRPTRVPFAGRRWVAVLPSLLLVALVLVLAASGRAEAKECTYLSATWNVRARRALAPVTVRHPYEAVTPAETDPTTGCTVCREDQALVEVPGVAPFLLCHKLAAEVEKVLRRLVAQGVRVSEVVGYRVGKTRGALDARGNRTVFSNHSFGVALDINPSLNGLYNHCPVFGPSCKLQHGGPWRPGVNGALTAEGPIVKAFAPLGLRWGGAIDGDTKDFMHLSPTGH